MSVDRSNAIETLQSVLYIFANDTELRDPSGYPLSADEIDAIRLQITQQLRYLEGYSPNQAKLYMKQVAAEPVIADLVRFGKARMKSAAAPGAMATTQYDAAQAASSFVRWFEATQARIENKPLPQGISQAIIDMLRRQEATPKVGPSSMLVPPTR